MLYNQQLAADQVGTPEYNKTNISILQLAVDLSHLPVLFMRRNVYTTFRIYYQRATLLFIDSLFRLLWAIISFVG